MISSTITGLIDQYGYFVFFLAFSLGPFGIPVPNEVTLLTAVFLGRADILNPLTAYLCILTGLLTAVTLSYTLGRFCGDHFNLKLQNNRRFQKAQLLLQKHGKWAMAAGFFLPVVRYIMPMLAGFSGTRFKTFMIISYFGAFVWTALFSGIGTLIAAHIL